MKPEVFFAPQTSFLQDIFLHNEGIILIIIILVTGDRYDCKLWSSLSKN